MSYSTSVRRRLRHTQARLQLWTASRRSRPVSHGNAESLVRLGIGPKNTAGQAHAWARAAETHETGVHAESFGPRRDSVVDFASDRIFSPDQWHSRSWQVKHASYLLSEYSHLLIESGASVFGNLLTGSFDGDLPYLGRAGVRVGLVFHGSDIRNPDHHSALEELSPFRLTQQDLHTDPAWRELVATLRQRTSHLKYLLDSDGLTLPKFVTTPGLLDYVPDAQWLPSVVETHSDPESNMPTESPPVVLHLPTNERMKGSHHIDAVCKRLELDGVLRYRRPGLIRPEDAAELLRHSFCVVDAMSLGDGPSITACQAMAAGVPVVGHISDSVRSRIPVDLPIVEATPATLNQVLRRLLSTPEEVARLSAAGRAYVERFHSGRFSAEVLLRFIRHPDLP